MKKQEHSPLDSRGMRWLAFAVVAVIVMFFPARAQAPSGKEVREPLTKDRFRDFDIREQAGGVAENVAGLQDAQSVTIVKRREAAAQEFVLSTVPERGMASRIALNRFGLPKSFFNERVPLSAPSQKEPEQIARDFLKTHAKIFPLNALEVENLRLDVKDVSDGAVFLSFHQTLNGINVFRGQVKITLNSAGQVMQAGVGDVIPQLSLMTNPRLTPEEAVKAAVRIFGLPVPAELVPAPSPLVGAMAFQSPFGDQYSAITAELSIFPMTATAARLAYRIFLEIDGSSWFEVLVDADDGRLLFRHNLYESAARGRVWKEWPQKSPRELVAFPDPWIPASSTVTTGNDVDAYLDTDGDNKPDTASASDIQNGRAFSATQTFDFPAGEGTTGQDPRDFKAAAVTNLFYFVNVAHDYFYALGFNEAAGNFQTDNFGRGGLGGDAVRAEAQDGSVVDNANFSSTPDGMPPRMQAGLFTRGTSSNTDDLDVAYDGQIVIHEYAHGVSNRIVGGRTDISCLRGMQSRALGEGWSDYFAVSFFNYPVLGAYAAQNSVKGGRRQSYEGYTFTYEDLGNEGFEVHRDGEIWAATLWDLRKTLGQSVTDRLVMNGLKSTPCNPSMIDARDGILTADRTINADANRAKIWQVFARHGMGYSAGGFDGTSFTGTGYNAAFDQPPDLQPGNKTPTITSRPSGPPALGQQYVYDVDASDPDGDALRYELTQGPAGMTIDPTTGVIRWTASFTPQRVKATVTDGRGGKVVHGFYVPVDTPLKPGVPVTIAAAKGEAGIARITVPAGTVVLQVTLRGGAGDPDVELGDPEMSLRSTSKRLGTTETLSIPLPAAGVWTIVVGAYQTFSGVTLTASLPAPANLPGNTTRANLSGDLSSESFYRVVVPSGATTFRVSTSGGTGDVDLFVRQNQPPVCQVVRVSTTLKRPYFCSYDYSSVGFDTNSESVGIPGPAAGDWYIDLSASAPYSGVTLMTALEIAPTLVLSASELVFSVVEGAAAPPAQTLAISNAAGTSFSWTAAATTASGGNWLRLGQPSGTGDFSIPVSVNPAELKQGTYRGTITVAATGLARSPLTVAVTLNVTARPVLAVGATRLTFFANPGQNPAPQSVEVSSAGGGTLEWTAVAATTPRGNWLVVSPASGTGKATLRVEVYSATLAGGVYNGTITINAPGATNSPAVLPVTLTMGLPVLLSSDGIVNAGSFARNRPVTGGEIVSFFGSNFTDPCSVAPGGSNPPCPQAAGFPLPVRLGATQVTFNGIPAPLLLVTPGQINLVAPFGLVGTTAAVVVSRDTTLSAPVAVSLAEQSIGIFTALSNGAGAGIILHADGRLVSRAAPIEPDEVVVIYGTGMGAVFPPVQTGTPAPASPLAETTVPMRVLFDGGEGRVLFSGLAPGFAGLYQMNVRTPSSLARRFPTVRMQSAVSSSNDVSAGGPSVLDVTPGTAQAGADLPVTLRGINFAPGSALRVAGENIAAAFADGGLQTLTATIPGRLLRSPGELSISVVDPAAPGEEPSNPVYLTIAGAPPVSTPRITALSPSSGETGQTISNFTISGENLGGVTAIEVSPSTGITLGNSAATATTVTAQLTIAADAAVGDRSVAVFSSAGRSNTLTFTIRQKAALPRITSLNPNNGETGQTISNFTISGENLGGVTAIEVSPSTGITLGNIAATATTVTAQLTIAADAAAGDRSVAVFSSAGRSNTLTFTIKQKSLGLQITSLSPGSGDLGQTISSFTITGENLSGVTAIEFSPSDRLTITDLKATATSVTAQLAIATNADTGDHTVSVVSPLGRSNTLTFLVRRSPTSSVPVIYNFSGTVINTETALRITGSFDFTDGKGDIIYNPNDWNATAQLKFVIAPMGVRCTLWWRGTWLHFPGQTSGRVNFDLERTPRNILRGPYPVTLTLIDAAGNESNPVVFTPGIWSCG